MSKNFWLLGPTKNLETGYHNLEEIIKADSESRRIGITAIVVAKSTKIYELLAMMKHDSTSNIFPKIPEKRIMFSSRKSIQIFSIPGRFCCLKNEKNTFIWKNVHQKYV